MSADDGAYRDKRGEGAGLCGAYMVYVNENGKNKYIVYVCLGFSLKLIIIL